MQTACAIVWCRACGNASHLTGRSCSLRASANMPNHPMDEEQYPLDFNDRFTWRSWLEDHHATRSEAWLIIQKKRSKLEGISLEEAVEEAVCFGWIDGKLNTLDDQRYLLRFTPRKPGSVWSISNIRRAEALIRAGAMEEAGLAAIHEAKRSGQWKAAIERENTDRIPPELRAALRRKKGAIAAYRSLPDSQKKQYVYWIQSAKREQTKRKRIAEIVRKVGMERS